MRIVFLTGVTRKLSGKTIVEEGLGGTHSAMINLAMELTEHGNEVTVFSNCQGEEGVYCRVNYLMMNKIIRFSKENEIDVFICVASESALKANIRAKKTVLWLHNDYSPYWKNELSDIASQLSEYMAVKSDKIVTVSQWQKNIIKDLFKIPENHIEIKPNGVNLKHFENSITRNKKKLIYSSAPDRGLDLTLEIFPLLKKEEPELELHIFSGFSVWGKDDWNYREIEDEIFMKANQEGVFIHKPVPGHILAEELKSGYLWIYPNHPAIDTYFNAETFCISALEAMASGLPVITSKRGALPEIVKDGITGFLINGNPYSEEFKNEFINKVLLLIRNNELWEGFSTSAREWSVNFNWGKITNEWQIFLEKLLLEKETTKLNEAPLKPVFPFPEVSVIIPTYNRAGNLFHCMTALTRQTFKNFEVIISDDGSTDNTSQVVDLFRNKLNIRYAYGGENKGFRAARTRNIGLKKARGSLVVFLDSDIITPSSYLEEHIKAHQIYDELLVNSFVFRMKSYKEEDLGLPPEEYIPKHYDNLNDDIKYEFNVFQRKEPIDEGYFLDSNSLSIKAKHILNDGFDQSFVGWGHEDTELGYRYAHKGFKFLFIMDNCKSYHIHHDISPEKDNETAVNWKRLTKKFKLKSWYHPLPKIEVEGIIKINGFSPEKAQQICEFIPARFELNVGDKFNGLEPFKTFNVSNDGVFNFDDF